MPFDAKEVAARLGLRYDPAILFPPPPPRKTEPYRWSATRYLFDDAYYSGTRWWIESQLAYLAYANTTAQLAPFQSILGAQSIKLVKYLDPQTPNWVLIKWPQVTYIAFQGSTNWLEYVGNVTGQAAVSPAAPLPGKIAAVWKVAADLVLPDVVAELHQTRPDSWFVLAGHSLGAAVAEVVGRYLFQFNNWAARRVVSFGGPRVGTAAWAINDYPPLFRAVNDGDVVTQLPPSGAAHFAAATSLGVTFLGLANYEHSRSTRMQVRRDGKTISTGSDRRGADGTVNALWEALQETTFPKEHRLKEYEFRLYLSQRKRELKDEPFLSALHSAYLDLRLALNDL